MRPFDQEFIDGEMFDDEDGDMLSDVDPGEECGRWLNGRLMPVYWCRKAGSEECDWECPLRDPPRAKSGGKSK